MESGGLPKGAETDTDHGADGEESNEKKSGAKIGIRIGPLVVDDIPWEKVKGSFKGAGKRLKKAVKPSKKTVLLLVLLLMLVAAAGGYAYYRHLQVTEPGYQFRDCDQCPEMVVVPAGEFTMGSPSYEGGRFDNEGPQHRVVIGKPFAVGKYEVTFAEWDACVSARGCGGYRPADEGWGRGRRPVIGVSWVEAQAYVSWLSDKTGKSYRLLSESEWEYAARAGTKTRYHFGNEASQLCQWGNVADQSAKRKDENLTIANCDDGYVNTAPVGSYQANGFCLHDMHGNVWEGVEDCWNDSYAGAPNDGSAWKNGDCDFRVLRSGSWLLPPGSLRSAYRGRNTLGNQHKSNGLRVARTLSFMDLDPFTSWMGGQGDAAPQCRPWQEP